MGHVVNQMAALNVSDEEKIANDRIESTQYLLSALSELDKCTKIWHLRGWITKVNGDRGRGVSILSGTYGINGQAELIKEGAQAFHRAKALMIRKIAAKLAKSLRIKALNEVEEVVEVAEAEEPVEAVAAIIIEAEKAAEVEEAAEAEEDEEAAAEAVGEGEESEEEDPKEAIDPGPSSHVKPSKKKRFYKIDMRHSHAKARGKIYFDETLTLGHPKKIDGVWAFEPFNGLQYTFAYYNAIKQRGDRMYAEGM
jgi:hypothetical protein